jgi:two-component system, OmpR family, KDP operon response regulator KdpE
VSDPSPLILVVEDEPQMRRFLRAALGGHRYRLVEAATAKEGLAHAAGRNPDVILLDLGLPDEDGLQVTRQIREWSQVPIIVISARGKEPDKVRALDLGADDYLTKPFGVEELLARIRVALRHALATAGAAPEPVYQSGDLTVDLANRQVTRAGRTIHLTPTEYKLLAALVRHAGKLLTHRQLLQEVWGGNYVSQFHYLRIYIMQLRQKIEENSTLPRYILTEPGVGYRFKEMDD